MAKNNKKNNGSKLSHDEIQKTRKMNRKILGKKYYKGGVFEPYMEEEEKSSKSGLSYIEEKKRHFEESIRVEIEKGINELIKENEEEQFFQFVRRQTSDFDRLLENYDAFINQGLGMRGIIPKIPQTKQAQEFQEKMMMIIDNLNGERHELDEEVFLEDCAKKIPNIKGIDNKTLKRIIDARLMKIRSKKPKTKKLSDLGER